MEPELGPPTLGDWKGGMASSQRPSAARITTAASPGLLLCARSVWPASPGAHRRGDDYSLRFQGGGVRTK